MVKTFSFAHSLKNSSEFEPTQTLVIYDRRLEKVSPEFRRWIRHFPHRYAVASGEKLKELREFPLHFEKLADLSTRLTPRTMTVVAIGGGSVGDFAGFFASIYKRGVRLVHIPSTWLAAIDSSHGGKTALNNRRVKNQLGTFYPAQRVLLERSLLEAQPAERIADGMGELGKIAIIDGGPWVQQLEQTRLRGSDLLWKFLKPAIESKLKVVTRDPHEQTGVRQVLNLGHTVGHVFEAHYGWTHGHAVAQGLFFAIEFALERGSLKPKEAGRALSLLTEKLELAREIPAERMSGKDFLQLLNQDKKKTSASAVTFLMPEGFGRVRRIPMEGRWLLAEAKRQGWVRA